MVALSNIQNRMVSVEIMKQGRSTYHKIFLKKDSPNGKADLRYIKDVISCKRSSLRALFLNEAAYVFEVESKLRSDRWVVVDEEEISLLEDNSELRLIVFESPTVNVLKESCNNSTSDSGILSQESETLGFYSSLPVSSNALDLCDGKNLSPENVSPLLTSTQKNSYHTENHSWSTHSCLW